MVILVDARREPVCVGVRVPEVLSWEEMEAGMTLETTEETVERSTLLG